MILGIYDPVNGYWKSASRFCGGDRMTDDIHQNWTGQCLN
jgi:hypothetical protein